MFGVNTMKNKILIYTVLFVSTLLVSFLFTKSLIIEIDKIFKANVYYTLFFVVIAYLAGRYTNFFKNRRVYVVFEIIFLVGLSSGIGIVITNLIYYNQISYLGLTNIFSSLGFLAFVLGRR